MLQIMVCDDDPALLGQLRRQIDAYTLEYRRECRVACCTTARELLNTDFDYDILFLDIMLDNGNDGIEIGKKLRSDGNKALFIIVTSRTDRAMDGYEATVFRYLTKPVQKKRLFQVLNSAIETLEQDTNVLTVKFKYETSYVHVKDIIYVESYLRKRHIVTGDRQYPTTAPWQTLLEQFSQYPIFFSPRTTHLINLAHVTGQSQTGITMTNGMRIKFAPGKYELFLEAYTGFLRKRGRIL